MTANSLAQSSLQVFLIVTVTLAVSHATTLDQIKDAVVVDISNGARQFEALLGKRTLGPKKTVAPQKHVAIVGFGTFEDGWNTVYLICHTTIERTVKPFLVFPVWLSDSEYTFNVEFTSASDPADPTVGKVHAKIVAQAELDILYRAYYNGVASNENREEIKNNLFLKALEYIKKLAKIEQSPKPKMAGLP